MTVEDEKEGVAEDDWVGLPRASEISGIKIHTLRRRARAGLIPAKQLRPWGDWLIHRAVVDELRISQAAKIERARRADEVMRAALDA